MEKCWFSGGYNGGYLNSAELYDPSTGKLVVLWCLEYRKTLSHSIRIGKWKVLVSGGYNGGYLNSAELYDPLTETGRLLVS